MLIFGIIVALIVTVYSGAFDNQRLNEAAEGIVAQLQNARSKTLASKDDSGGSGKKYAVHFDDKNATSPNRAVLFVADGAGYAYSPTDLRNVVYSLPVGMEISSIALPPASGDKPEVYFERITGNGMVRNAVNNLVSLSIGIFVITSKRSGNARGVTINPLGVVEVN